MFLELSSIMLIFIILSLALAKTTKQQILVIVCIIIIGGAGIYGNTLSWKHYTKSIIIENKTIDQHIPFIPEKTFGGNDGIKYYVNDNINYSKIEINKTYIIDVSYNDDINIFYRGPYAQWVDHIHNKYV